MNSYMLAKHIIDQTITALKRRAAAMFTNANSGRSDFESMFCLSTDATSGGVGCLPNGNLKDAAARRCSGESASDRLPVLARFDSGVVVFSAFLLGSGLACFVGCFPAIIIRQRKSRSLSLVRVAIFMPWCPTS
jgi:hypothetical protein